MTPALTWALIRDAAILIVLGLIYLQGRHQGAESVKSQDLKAVQSQLAENALRQQQYAQEARDAQTQHSHDVETISAAIASHADQPIRVCVTPSPSAVRGISTTTTGQPASSGGTHEATRDDSESTINVRNKIDEFERQFEGALADCREMVSSWPK